MTIEKIEIGKSVEALHEWHKLSLTVSILPGEDPQLIHKEAKELLDKLLPGIDSQEVSTPEEKPQSKEQGLIQVIQLCNSVTALERFRPQVEALNNIQVTGRFNNKLKNLKGEHN